MTDPDLTAAWMDYWWGTPEAVAPEAVKIANNALADFQAHLAEHGFAIVRRMDPDLPG